MKGAIASVDVYLQPEGAAGAGMPGGEGGAVRRLTLTITAPERAPGGWSCRVALADRHRPETFVAPDSVSALMAAVERGRSWLAELAAGGDRLTRDRAGSDPFELG